MLYLSTILATIISAITGGSLIHWYRTYFSPDQEEHVLAMNLVTTLREDVGHVQKRQGAVETEIAESRRAEALLTVQVQLLIERIYILFDRLDQYETISDDERRRYTDVPDVSSPA